MIVITNKTRNVTITAIVFFLLGVGIFVTLYTQIEKMGGVLEGQLAVIADNSAREKEYNALTRLVESSAAERAQLKEFVLTETDTITFLTNIEQISRNQGIQLSTESLTPASPEGSVYDDLEVVFVVVGSMAQMKDMIKILESLPYHGELEVVEISEHKTRGPEVFEGRFKLRLSLITYD